MKVPGILLLAGLALGACSGEEPDGETASNGADPAQPAAQAANTPDGAALYERHCLVCHQADGRGVPRFQPPIVGSEWLNGDPQTLAAFVLTGGFDSAAREDRAAENVMPPFDTLSDTELATLLTYIRQRFGENAGPVSPEDVAAARETTGS